MSAVDLPDERAFWVELNNEARDGSTLTLEMRGFSPWTSANAPILVPELLASWHRSGVSLVIPARAADPLATLWAWDSRGIRYFVQRFQRRTSVTRCSEVHIPEAWRVMHAHLYRLQKKNPPNLASWKGAAGVRL